MHILALRRNTKKCHDRLDSKGKNFYVLWAIFQPGILEDLAALDFGNIPGDGKTHQDTCFGPDVMWYNRTEKMCV